MRITRKAREVVTDVWKSAHKRKTSQKVDSEASGEVNCRGFKLGDFKNRSRNNTGTDRQTDCTEVANLTNHTSKSLHC